MRRGILQQLSPGIRSAQRYSIRCRPVYTKLAPYGRQSSLMAVMLSLLVRPYAYLMLEPSKYVVPDLRLLVNYLSSTLHTPASARQLPVKHTPASAQWIDELMSC